MGSPYQLYSEFIRVVFGKASGSVREGFGISRRAPEGFPKKGRIHPEGFTKTSGMKKSDFKLKKNF